MFDINNRRYLGCKSKLVDFIDKIVSHYCSNCETFLDLFAGTGTVAFHFKNKYKVIVNDILSCNCVAYETFFSSARINKTKVLNLLNEFNSIDISSVDENYYSLNFADTFLSKENMKRIGYIRDRIDDLYSNNEINKREKSVLLTSLLYAIDKNANTVGHYDAFRKNGCLDKKFVLDMPHIDDTNNKGNLIFKEDANLLVKNLQSDIVYIDPPYNSRQYCDAYHFLENVALNQKPEVFGKARKMDRSNLKSSYCTNKATLSFKSLIEDINAKFIIVSYNNTGNKINSRSNAKISDTDITEILRKKGKVTVYSQDFNAFTTGKTDVEGHQERLFVCEVGVKENSKEVNSSKNSPSPLNYTGGKFKILPQLKSLFPKNIETFYDVFCGGCNVAANISSNKIVCIDTNKHLISLLKFLKKSNYIDLESKLLEKISKYGLSDSFVNGYEFYDCNSGNGLGRFNKTPYLKLRQEYNESKSDLLFLLLILYGFNNQIRFNSKDEFNLPVGKRDFNSCLRQKLKLFISNIKANDVKFENKDFRKLNIDKLASEKAFLYLDPPYSLGTATYNENGGWCDKDDQDLFNFLDNCSNKGINFALSNVSEHKGMMNTALLTWAELKGYTVHKIEHNYANANYHIKDRSLKTQEVLVTNY